MTEDIDTFDYVVVGSGAAGSIVAARLAEDVGTTVCVLEAGPSDKNRYISIPAGFIKTLFDPAYTWQFRTEPSPHIGGRQIATIQGRVVGGSSSVNGMIYNRGLPSDFNHWAQLGNRGWGYEDVLPYFRRTERRIGFGADGVRGRDGALPVTDMDWIHPVSEAFIAGAVGMGIPRNPDYNSGDQPGVGYFQRTIHRGRRISAARAFLWPALRRGNINLRTEARASSIVFDKGRAVGVRYLNSRGGTPREIRARREVVLCCGTANTARLLQVSGVGSADLLSRIGVPVVHVLSGVGEKLKDHYSIRSIVRAKPDVITLNEIARNVRLGVQIARWILGKPSILAVVPSQVYAFWKSAPHLEDPDLQFMFTPGSYKHGRNYVLDDYPGMTCGVEPHRPESFGYVRARSADVFEDPVIQPNYLAAETDRRTIVAGLKLVRRLLSTPELARYVESEILPGPQVRSDDELLDYCRNNGSTGFHLVGTCRMGPAGDSGAVVDDRLRVHGLRGLRVVDASIMPNIPSANTYASTMMIGEKGADLIREDAKTGAG